VWFPSALDDHRFLAALPRAGRKDWYVMTLFIIAAVVYFIPMLIAMQRNHPQRGPIIIIDLFLGWTLLGWVVALAWACSAFTQVDKPKRVRHGNRAAEIERERAAEIEREIAAREVYRDGDKNPFPAGSMNARAWDRSIAERKAAQ
jgi:hypothetical protein